MFRKKPKNSIDPVISFTRALHREFGKNPNIVVRMERLPQGKMKNHIIRYVPADEILSNDIDSLIADEFGRCDCLLMLADEDKNPLVDVRCLKIEIGTPLSLKAKKNEAISELFDATTKLVIDNVTQKKESESKLMEALILGGLRSSDSLNAVAITTYIRKRRGNQKGGGYGP